MCGWTSAQATNSQYNHFNHHTSALTSEAAIVAAVQEAGYRCRHLKTDVAAPSKNKGTSGFHGQVRVVVVCIVVCIYRIPA